MWDRVSKNDVVVITGGSTGLGFALAEGYAERGCKLVLNARDQDDLARAQQKLRTFYPSLEVEIVAADVGNPSGAKKLISEALLGFGRIDLLINCAGVIQAAPYLKTTEADFEATLHSNLWAMIHCCRAVMPTMLQAKRGRILNVASVGGISAVPHLTPYSTSKFGAIGFSTSLSTEVRSKGIYITTVAPSLMRTGSFGSVEIKGDHQVEYGLFKFIDNWKLSSLDPHQAAKEMMEATDRKQPFKVIGLLARIQHILFNLFPNTTIRLLALASQALPEGTGPESRVSVEGKDLAEPLPPWPVRERAQRAQNDLNQVSQP